MSAFNFRISSVCLAGNAFDKAYRKQMLFVHKKTIAPFQNEAAAGNVSYIKALSERTLRTMSTHIKMVIDAMNGKAADMS